MTIKQIYIEPIQTTYDVKFKDANKQKRNRTFSNASPCCNALLKQEKRCSDCNEIVATADCKHKIITISKQQYLIDSAVLQQIQDNLSAEADKVKIHSFLSELPAQAEDYYDSLVYVLPVPKKEQHYAELSAILKDKYAVGTAVLRNNEYQVILSVGDDNCIRLRKLIDASQRYDIVFEQPNTEPRSQIINLSNQIISKKLKDSYDFSAFKDSRSEYEEKVIEEYVVNGKMPELAKIQTQSASDDLARLQALLEGEQ